MPERRKFRQRLDAWRQELKNQIIAPLTTISFRGCAAPPRLTPGEAERLPFLPMPPGTAWGDHRQYAWFAAEAAVPPGVEGRRLVLLSGVGGEQLVYVNGVPAGSVDREHPFATLCRQAPAEGRLRILIESYAGNGPRLEHLGPCPPERDPLPPIDGPQCRVKESRLAVVNEKAYQLFMDVDTLARLHVLLPEGSLRREKIEEALEAFTHAVDLEAPADQREEQYQQGREVLAPALQCRNGSTAPLLRLIGQSHIDLAWLWPLEETFHKAARTYANQLALMEEYPEYRFLACEPALMEMLKERSPETYARVMDKARRGQIVFDGAFYVECDTNIPGGESLIRQLLWGKKWFRQEAGAESLVAWQPDTFGFSPCLPQLLQACGAPYFATQKLLRADPECERFPYQDFLWEGVDGTRVQALSFFKNNARTDPDNLHHRWEQNRTQHRGIDSLLFPFGYGDGGGGADRDMLEYLRREKDLEGLPRTAWSTLREHFEATADSARQNVWQGELYLPWHRGTYTSQRKTKTALRALEQALHDGEFLLAQCGRETREAHQAALTAAWKTLLVHQFHDIAAGVGIRDVHREAEQALTDACDTVREIITSAAREAYALTGEEGCYTLVNTLPFPRRAYVSLPGGGAGFVSLPPSGARAVTAEDLTAPEGEVRAAAEGTIWRIDNGVLRFTLNEDGTISDLTDLRTGLPLQAPGMRLNDLRLYKDVESAYDAWELSPTYVQDRIPLPPPLEITLTGENSPVLTVSLRRVIGQSPCRERITLRAGCPRIEFSLQIDWQERHKLLKAHFETDLRCENALHEMQFCHVQRPAHRSTAFARDRFEVCNHHYTALFEATRGAALLNRAIWGVSCQQGDMALTLLHAPCVPDDTCDRGEQTFDFALCVYDQPFAFSPVTFDGYAYNAPPLTLPGRGRDASGVWAENALIETVKPADDGDGLILRLWEYRGARARAILHLPRPARIFACDFDETNAAPRHQGDAYAFDLPAFGIRTLRICE